MENNEYIGGIINALLPRLREYLEEKHIKIDGKGFFSCIHPNHPDKNPSCSIGGSLNETVFHCFSCNTAGNLFHAVHFLEGKPLTGIGFYEDTLKHLANKYGVEYEPIAISDDVKREYQKRRAYHDAVSVIHYGVWKGTDLKTEHPAIKHLTERGITEETIKKFKIGCIDSYSDYLNEMKSMGWTDREWLNGADLANKGLFHKDGIIIPIFEADGNPVGFVTRKTNMPANAKGQEKYVNSLNSDIYHKSEILFNFQNYKNEDGPLYIVEGYLDAVYLTQVGLKNVSAIGATVLTDHHIKLLMDHGVKNIILCLDADDGGNNGVKLAIERLSPYKYFSLRIMELPEGSDPDSYVREESLDKFLELAKPEVALSSFAWTLKHTTFEDDPMETAQRAIPTIAAEESNIMRLKMIRELSRLTGISEADIKKDVDSLVNKDSSVFIEELNNINNFVQVQLNKRKVKDTRSILEDAMIKIKNLEKLHNNTVDNRTEYESRRSAMRDKIDGGEYKYGLYAPRFKKLEKMFDGIPYTTCLTLVGGRPSAGKCLSPDELVWMYNGSLKRAKDVQYGDLLMGDDSTPRQVLGTTSGEDYMYDVIQSNGISYRVNEPHVLSLKRSRNGITVKHGDTIDIPLNKFIKKSNKFKDNFKGYKVPIEFKDQEVPIDPYFLGLWIGDGDSNSSKIYTVDHEIVDYIYEYADTLSLQVTENKNGTCPSYAITKGKCFNSRNLSLQQLLRVEGILDNKHIPEKYIINSRENRLELLAGLLDSDGWYSTDKGYFEITQKNEVIARSIKKLADTLGFRTNLAKKKTQCKESKYQGEVYRLLISGNVWVIPTKVRRKIAPKVEKRDWTMSQIEIRSVGRGKYAGFQLDGNGRFLLSDGTVTHNTTWLTALGMDIIESNDDAAIFYMSIDDTTELMNLKMMATRSGLSTSKIKRYVELPDKEKSKVNEAFSWLDKISERFIISDASSGNTIETLEAHIDWFCKNFPNSKRIFMLDNFHKLSTHGMRSSKTEAVSAMSEKIKTLTQLNDLHFMMTIELRKLEGSAATPQVADLKDSVQMEYDADAIILAHNDYQVNDKTNILWKCDDIIDGAPGGLMPILENRVWKNKITGVIGPLAYNLNSHNLQITEANYAYVRNLRNQKSGNSIKVGGGMRTH